MQSDHHSRYANMRSTPKAYMCLPTRNKLKFVCTNAYCLLSAMAKPLLQLCSTTVHAPDPNGGIDRHGSSFMYCTNDFRIRPVGCC